MYTVRRLYAVIGEESSKTIYACDSHRDAAARSGLGRSGATLIVEGAGALVRYHVDALGRMVEQSRYSTERR